MRRLIETAVIFAGTLGWWGFVYPELCLTEETYAGTGIITEQEEREADDSFSGEKIRIKSRLLEYILSEDITE